MVGDVIHLSIGDQVPGDGIFIQGHQLTIDESSMTGESQPVSACDRFVVCCAYVILLSFMNKAFNPNKAKAANPQSFCMC